jgi:hypothetical protein
MTVPCADARPCEEQNFKKELKNIKKIKMQKITFEKKMDYDKALAKIFEYKEKRQFLKGLKILHGLNKEYINDSIINGLLGTFYYEKKNYLKSAKYFRVATILNPDSELSSFGLFHSLMFLGKIISALNEINRFAATHETKLYRTTILELKKEHKSFNKREISLISKL